MRLIRLADDSLTTSTQIPAGRPEVLDYTVLVCVCRLLDSRLGQVIFLGGSLSEGNTCGAVTQGKHVLLLVLSGVSNIVLIRFGLTTLGLPRSPFDEYVWALSD